MTGRQGEPTRGQNAWWILFLAVLAVGVGLLLLWVAGREPDRTPDAKRPRAEGARKGSGRGDLASPEDRTALDRVGRGAASRADRAHLARLLRQGSPPGAGADPGADPGAGPGAGPGASGGTRGGALGGDSPGEDGETAVYPISAKGIRGAIRARIAEIKECYEGWLAADDELGGKLTLAFTIEADPDGELARISNAEVQSSTLDHPGLERCVLVMAESLRFEAPAGGRVTVRYPFRFAPAPD